MSQNNKKSYVIEREMIEIMRNEDEEIWKEIKIKIGEIKKFHKEDTSTGIDTGRRGLDFKIVQDLNKLHNNKDLMTEWRHRILEIEAVKIEWAAFDIGPDDSLNNIFANAVSDVLWSRDSKENKINNLDAIFSLISELKYSDVEIQQRFFKNVMQREVLRDSRYSRNSKVLSDLLGCKEEYLVSSIEVSSQIQALKNNNSKVGCFAFLRKRKPKGVGHGEVTEVVVSNPAVGRFERDDDEAKAKANDGEDLLMVRQRKAFVGGGGVGQGGGVVSENPMRGFVVDTSTVPRHVAAVNSSIYHGRRRVDGHVKKKDEVVYTSTNPMMMMKRLEPESAPTGSVVGASGGSLVTGKERDGKMTGV